MNVFFRHCKNKWFVSAVEPPADSKRIETRNETMFDDFYCNDVNNNLGVLLGVLQHYTCIISDKCILFFLIDFYVLSCILVQAVHFLLVVRSWFLISLNLWEPLVVGTNTVQYKLSNPLGKFFIEFFYAICSGGMLKIIAKKKNSGRYRSIRVGGTVLKKVSLFTLGKKEFTMFARAVIRTRNDLFCPKRHFRLFFNITTSTNTVTLS